MGILDRFKKAPKEPPAPTPAPEEPKAVAAESAPAETPASSVAAVAQTPAAAPAEVAQPAPAQQEPTQSAPAAPAKPTGFFAKIRAGLKKTTQILNTDIKDLFKTEGRFVDDAFLEDLREILIKTDMGVKPAGALVDQVKVDFRGRVVHMHEVVETLKKKLYQLLEQNEAPIRFADSGVTVIMVAGVNGAGKTTSIAKLARLFTSQGKKVVLGAADTFRAAAVEQLTIWAGRLGAEIVTGEAKSDPASVAHRAVARAVETGAEVCIIDTAGRLQTQQNLMKELTKIHNVIGKKVPGAPHEVILVLDATTGQNGISQAKSFSEAVQCSGIVLAKIDGTAKGGVVVAIRQQVGLPVKYLGVGEKAEDLTLFKPQEFVDAMFEDLVPPPQRKAS